MGSRVKKRSSSKRKKCGTSYVRSKISGKCVFKTGTKGRALNKKRAAVKKSHKRSGRPSPNISATLFSIGHVQKGADGNLWKIKKTSKENNLQ